MWYFYKDTFFCISEVSKAMLPYQENRYKSIKIKRLSSKEDSLSL
ncbi:hypothetical protein CAPGI0001_2592 [Capnocytophaga gingivalis ATCC 33624]|nr:hypothetical protein CAPGI0001_2592 [Capnocytophaga gingivalis ATCC 33624]